MSRIKQINWWFVFGTVAQLYFAFVTIVISFMAGLVGLTLLPPGFDDGLKANAVEHLSNFGLALDLTFKGDVVSMLPAGLVCAVAIWQVVDAGKSGFYALSTDAGIEKCEYNLMARCAALGCSLSIVESEGYVAVLPDQSRTRIWRMADLEQFIRDLEGKRASASADRGGNRAHTLTQ